MTERRDELRWRWRMLVLDLLVEVALRVGVPGERWVELRGRQLELLRGLEVI